MAGDWVKVEIATLDKPEVVRMAELLGVKRDEMIGILVRFWAWLDRSTGNGLVTHVSRIGIDDVMHCAGFAAALESVGWAQFDEKAVSMAVPNFDYHNGNPAKTRALGQRRKRRFDERKSNDVVTQTPLPEKRREVTPIVPKGFAEFWEAYPLRKSKATAEKAWTRIKPDDSLAARILEAVAAAKKSTDWTKEGGRFIPYPASWLNARGWEDEARPAPGLGRLAV